MKYLLLFAVFFSAVHCSAAEKIVSLSPNLTEIICLLGGTDTLRGRSSACDFPEEIRKVPVAGSFGKATPEAVLASGATVVVTAADRAPQERALLEQAGIRYIVIPAKSLADYESALRTIGKLLGKSETAEAEIQKNRRAFARFHKSENPPSVFVMISPSPLCTAGRRTFIHELIELAGGHNIAGTEEREYFTVSPEWVLRRNPDILISCGVPLPPDSILRGTKAARSGKVLTEFDPSLLYRLGPRTIKAAQKLNEYFYRQGK